MFKKLCVLVTRPAPYGEKLAAAIQQHGDRAVLLPTLIITPWHDISDTQHLFSKLEKMQWVIFTSPQAVHHAKPFLPTMWSPYIRVAAMGKGTERALNQLDIQVNVLPKHEFTSEALLDAPEFKEIAGQSVLIVKGAGGRTTLSDTLQQRGAVVHHAIVYQRTTPRDNTLHQEQQLENDLQQPGFLLVSIVTSSESLLNLKKLVHTNTWQKLQNFPIIIPSSRIASLASELGFRYPRMCNALDDQAILNCLNDIRQHHTG